MSRQAGCHTYQLIKSQELFGPWKDVTTFVAAQKRPHFSRELELHQHLFVSIHVFERFLNALLSHQRCIFRLADQV